MTNEILAIDQGTTSSRAIIFDASGAEVQTAREGFHTSFPQDGWVELDAEEVWQSVSSCLEKLSTGRVGAVAITNQRETCLFWSRETGEALTPAVVWQCRRSAEICERLRSQGLESSIRKKTGLVIDAYFSGSKALWLIENLPGLKEKVQSGEALFGTIDS